MRKLFIIPVVLFSTISLPSWGQDFNSCSKNEMEDVWSKLQDESPFNDRERFCLAAKTVVYIEDVFIKDISPPTPREEEWVLGEYNYIKSPNANRNRVHEFMNNKLKYKYDLFNHHKVAKENLIGVMTAIKKSQKTLEMRYWANLASNLIRNDMYDDYWYLVTNGVVEQNPLAGLWSHIYLPSLLTKGIVLNN